MIHDFALGYNYYLYNSKKVPAVGLSTYRIRAADVVNTMIDVALDAGYRLFDTSPLYCNLINLGKAFATLAPRHGVSRKDLFLSSKIITLDSPYDTIRSMCTRTMKNMGIDYLDLLLLSSSLEGSINLNFAWNEAMELYREGKVHAIGVANFRIDQIEQVKKCGMAPMVNQVEWHPFVTKDQLYIYCKKNGILLQGYAPFGSPLYLTKPLLYNPVIRKLAHKYEATPAQIALMWSLQLGLAVVPATLNQHHLRENMDFELTLSKRDMRKISKLASSASD